MLTQVKKTHPALKHAGYSATTILPGEDSAAFEKLHRELIAELLPNGALEHDVVETIARLVWRKQNLATFRLAELARKHCDAIRYEHVAPVDKKYGADPMLAILDRGRAERQEAEAAERKVAVETADRQARKDLGEAYQLAEVGEPTTVDRLLQELGVEERLDAMIDKYLKRLLFVRGLKSLQPVSQSAPPQPVPATPRIPSRKKVA